MVPRVDYPEKAVSLEDLIARLPQAVARVDAALDGLTDAEMAATPIPGKWSIDETVAHIAGASVGWTNILFQAVEDAYLTPRAWSAQWDAPLQAELRGGHAGALAVFGRNNAAVARFLATLPPSDFARGFKIVSFLTEPYQIKESVNWGLVIHADYHLATIHRLRECLHTPLPWLQVYLDRYPKPTLA